MPNLNRVLLMGHLTRDPEMRFTPSNTAIAKIGLAVNRRWRNQAGEQQEETTFVDCDAFGKTAELINQYFRKGSPIFIEGRLKLDQWTDKEGQHRSKIGVVIENFQFVESKPRDHHNAAPTTRGASEPLKPAPCRTQPTGDPKLEPSDIPF